ncbi:glycosyltransferase [Psychromonas sp. MME2]|uniref:glycosyltransferase n=1 Tax=Psychromonas sp. MME2 TaxID=3231033 RepID=UPI00339CB121
MTVSKGIQNFINRIIPNVASSVVNLVNPFDIRALQRQGEDPQIINPINGRYLIFIGRLVAQKRVDRLLEAFALLDDKEIKLMIIGEGELKAELVDYAKTLKIDSRIVFLNFMVNPYPLLKQAELLVLCSDHEGLPTVMIESLIMETPVVATSCPSGPAEILGDFLPDHLVIDNCPSNIARCIDAALKDPRKICYAQGYQKYANQAVYDHFVAYLKQRNLIKSNEN